MKVEEYFSNGLTPFAIARTLKKQDNIKITYNAIQSYLNFSQRAQEEAVKKRDYLAIKTTDLRIKAVYELLQEIERIKKDLEKTSNMKIRIGLHNELISILTQINRQIPQTMNVQEMTVGNKQQLNMTKIVTETLANIKKAKKAGCYAGK